MILRASAGHEMSAPIWAWCPGGISRARSTTSGASQNAATGGCEAGIPVARVELLDEVQVRCCNTYSRLAMFETPMLFLEFHGSGSGVAEQSERFREIVREFDGGPFEWATEPEDRRRLWRARHDVFWANASFRPAARVVVTDVCVPISRLAECVTETKQDIERSGLVAPIVGHAGDGNFHACVLVMMDNAEEVARAMRSSNVSRSVRSPWREPAPANTGSAKARSGS